VSLRIHIQYDWVSLGFGQNGCNIQARGGFPHTAFLIKYGYDRHLICPLLSG
jgi:hypothetical protein